MKDVYIVHCKDYNSDRVYSAMKELLFKDDLLSFVKPHMTIGIKANMISFLKPEAAATTHPEVLKALSRILTELGAKVIIGDSPGGLYTPAFVDKVYSFAGMKTVEGENVALNRNFEQKTAKFPDAAVLKDFQYTAWLDDCDAVINFCKLKTHGMMGMSAAAKNMFGVIPGTIKPEYHFRFPNPEDFARMIVDINEYFRPVLSICDAVVGMEGNGPTAGTPRAVGGILASKSPYKLDLVCADIIGLDIKEIPTVMASIERKLTPDSVTKLDIDGDLSGLKIADYKNIEVHNSLLFTGKGGVLGTVFGSIAQSALSSRPVLTPSECVGCKECYNVCPAKAITMVDKKPRIDRKKCIRCFCCQEFCPKGALKVKRPTVAKILNK